MCNNVYSRFPKPRKEFTVNYKKEKELQVELTSRDLGVLDYSTLFIRREVAVGECIPDIVMVGMPNNSAKIIYPRKITSRHIFILWLIKQSKRITPVEIAEKSYQRLSKVNQIVDDLVSSGTVLKNEIGELWVQETIASLQTEVIAIEAKLSNWCQAFEQAKRYQGFADKVIVAMDAEKAPRRKEILEKFEEQNIGLCAVSPDSLEWLVYPQYEYVESFEKEYIVSSALSPSTHTLWERR